MSGHDLTVTERVILSDVRRNVAMKEHDRKSSNFPGKLNDVFFAVLSKALETADVDELAKSFASIKLSRSLVELEQKKQIALRRTGQRGFEARKLLLEAEAAVAAHEKRCVYPHELSFLVANRIDQSAQLESRLHQRGQRPCS